MESVWGFEYGIYRALYQLMRARECEMATPANANICFADKVSAAKIAFVLFFL